MDDFSVDNDLAIEDFDENGEPILAKKKVVHGDEDEFEDELPEEDLFGENLDALGISEEDFG